MKKIFYLGGLLFALAACNPTSQSSAEKSIIDSTKVENAVYADAQTDAIYTSYLVLKDNLVADNFQQAQVSALALAKILKQKQGCETTSANAEKLAQAKDIAEMRKNFVYVNTELVPFLKHQTLKSGKIYEQYCPMANEGNGANWISNAHQIRNPYYGSEMLDCGDVLDSAQVK